MAFEVRGAGPRANEAQARRDAGQGMTVGESVACKLLKCPRSPTSRATVESEEFPMPFLALFGFVSNLLRSVVRGTVGGAPAVRPITISERQVGRRRR